MSQLSCPPPIGGTGSFASRLEYSVWGERLIALWGHRRGNTVIALAQLPAVATGGPRLLTPVGLQVAPDLALFQRGRLRLAEVKRRTAPTRHCITGAICTGIERHDLDRYLAFAKATGTEVLLAFIHDRDVPELLGGDVADLVGRMHHEAKGMVFWDILNLDLLADAAEMAELRAELGGVR